MSKYLGTPVETALNDIMFAGEGVTGIAIAISNGAETDLTGLGSALFVLGRKIEADAKAAEDQLVAAHKVAKAA